MRRSLIGEGHCSAGVLFARGFAFHQHPHAVLQQHQFPVLSRDNIGQVLDRAGQVGQLFLEVGDGLICHTPFIAGNYTSEQRICAVCLAPAPCVG